MASNLRLHRVLRAAPERVYRAFVEPEEMVRWLPPYGFTATVHEMDARVGGGYRMSFTNFGTGSSHAFGGRYEELVPNQRIRWPGYLTGSRREGGEVPCPVVISTRGARRRTRQYVEHPEVRKRRWVRCIAARSRDSVRYPGLTDRFDDPAMPGEMRVTVTLTAVVCGTALDIEQAGLPEMIPVELCHLGWQESLAQLANLVEPHIPDPA